MKRTYKAIKIFTLLLLVAATTACGSARRSPYRKSLRKGCNCPSHGHINTTNPSQQANHYTYQPHAS